MLITLVEIVASPVSGDALALLGSQSLEESLASRSAHTIFRRDRHELRHRTSVAGNRDRFSSAHPAEQFGELAIGVGSRDGRHGVSQLVVLLTTLLRSRRPKQLKPAASLPSYMS